uniref:Uncharacterized protein n=1 Tax=Tanacetum cinerariifolium TaxID=118510 RepID=A0A699VYI8_TANCI|nr:hypothetical protein [Tanacetum cinerariifolium]
MPMNSISSRDGRLLCHEVVNDDFGESGEVQNLLFSRQISKRLVWNSGAYMLHFSESFQIKNTLSCVDLETD